MQIAEKVLSDEIAEDVPDRFLEHPNFPGVRLKPRLPTRIGQPDHVARHVSVCKVANHNGVMVALRLPHDLAKSLSIPGGEDPGDLHLTLAYLGEADEVTPEQHQRLLDDMKTLARRTAPFEGRINGRGVFQNGDERVLWAALDAPALFGFRHAVLDACREAGLEPAGDHGWTPHVTLAYDPEDDAVQAATEQDAGQIPAWTVKDVSVVVGGTEVTLKLQGEPDADKPQRVLPASTWSQIQRPEDSVLQSIDDLESWAEDKGPILLRPIPSGVPCVLAKKGDVVRVAIPGRDKPVRLDDLVNAFERVDHDFLIEGALCARDIHGFWLSAKEITSNILDADEVAMPVFFPADLLALDGDMSGKPARERWELLRSLVPVSGGHCIVPPQAVVGRGEDLSEAINSLSAWRPSEGKGLSIPGITAVEADSAYTHGETEAMAQLDLVVEKYSDDQLRDDRGRWTGEGLYVEPGRDNTGLVKPAGSKEEIPFAPMGSNTPDWLKTPSMSAAEKEAVLGYTDGQFAAINGALAKAEGATMNPSGAFVGEDLKPSIEALDKVTHTALKEPVTVWRGMEVPKSWADEHLKDGTTIVSPCYQSTSFDTQKATAFLPNDSRADAGDARVLFKINGVKEGCYASGVSKFPDEKELIMPRGATIKIDSVHDKQPFAVYARGTRYKTVLFVEGHVVASTGKAEWWEAKSRTPKTAAELGRRFILTVDQIRVVKEKSFSFGAGPGVGTEPPDWERRGEPKGGLVRNPNFMRPERKYSETQPRDEQGRFSDAMSQATSDLMRQGLGKERMIVLDQSTGERLQEDEGTETQAGNGINQNLLLGDSKLTVLHTHPYDQAFSDNDLAALGWSNVTNMRVLGTEHQYDMAKPEGVVVTPRAIRESFAKHEMTVYNDLERHLPASLTSDQFQHAVSTEVNKRVAADLGLKFSVSNLPSPRVKKYSEDQARDDHGRFANGGGSGAAGRVWESLHSRIDKPDGGFTVQPITGEEPHDGYAVSIYPDRAQTFEKTIPKDKFVGFVEKNADVLVNRDHYLGGWHDPADDKIYLDISVVKPSEADAKGLALTHHQIAYWDFKKGASVNVQTKALARQAVSRGIGETVREHDGPISGQGRRREDAGRPGQRGEAQGDASDQVTRKYSEDQPRDDHGRFSGGGDGASAGTQTGGLQDGRGVPGSASGVDTPSGSAGVNGPALEGLPKDSIGPNREIRGVAADYMRSAGLPYDPPTRYIEADPKVGSAIAADYEQMKHDPQNPEVRAAYQKFIAETHDQYLAIRQSGLKVDVIDFAKTGDPYAAGASAMHEDLAKGHMWLLPTSAAFGSDTSFDPKGNPLLAMTGESIGGHKLTANDEFRIVHDYFGHAKEGLDFSPSGEDNAWRSHVSMYSPEAARAMTTETRGQTSTVYFGQHGESNRSGTGPVVFADQKTGLLKAQSMRKTAASAPGVFGTPGTAGIISPQQGVFRTPRRRLGKEEAFNITVGVPISLVPTRPSLDSRRRERLPGITNLRKEYGGVAGGGSGDGDRTTNPPALGAHTFVVGTLKDGTFVDDPEHPRVNPYEALLLRSARLMKYDENEPRDELGRWTDSGAPSGATGATAGRFIDIWAGKPIEEWRPARAEVISQVKTRVEGVLHTVAHQTIEFVHEHIQTHVIDVPIMWTFGKGETKYGTGMSGVQFSERQDAGPVLLIMDGMERGALIVNASYPFKTKDGMERAVKGVLDNLTKKREGKPGPYPGIVQAKLKKDATPEMLDAMTGKPKGPRKYPDLGAEMGYNDTYDEEEKQGPPAGSDGTVKPKKPGDPEDAPSADGTLLAKTLGDLAGAVEKLAGSGPEVIEGPRLKRTKKTLVRLCEEKSHGDPTHICRGPIQYALEEEEIAGNG